MRSREKHGPRGLIDEANMRSARAAERASSVTEQWPLAAGELTPVATLPSTPVSGPAGPAEEDGVLLRGLVATSAVARLASR